MADAQIQQVIAAMMSMANYDENQDDLEKEALINRSSQRMLTVSSMAYSDGQHSDILNDSCDQNEDDDDDEAKF